MAQHSLSQVLFRGSGGHYTENFIAYFRVDYAVKMAVKHHASNVAVTHSAEENPVRSDGRMFFTGVTFSSARLSANSSYLSLNLSI